MTEATANHTARGGQPRAPTRPRKPSPALQILAGLATRTASAVAPGLAARWLERIFLTPRRYRMPAREHDWMAGAEVWKIPFDDRRRMPLFAWGAGPTVLLAHGFSGRGSQMGAYVRPLVELGYRVVAFDAPAHGDADGRRTSLPEAAEAVAKVADHLGPLAACIAHSNGAAATTVALARGMRCERVVYVSPPEDLWGFLLRAARFLGFSEAVARKTRRRVETRYGIGFDALRGGPLAAGQTSPALIVHDRDDAMVPFTEGQRLAARWPGAELMETRGLGHSRILRHPDVVAAATRFIGAAS